MTDCFSAVSTEFTIVVWARLHSWSSMDQRHACTSIVSLSCPKRIPTQLLGIQHDLLEYDEAGELVPESSVPLVDGGTEGKFLVTSSRSVPVGFTCLL